MDRIDTTSGFWFVGFIPHKKGRETLFKLINERISESPIVAYESSHRIEKTVAWFAGNAPSTKITLAREITKLHEELVLHTYRNSKLLDAATQNKGGVCCDVYKINKK